VKRSSLFRILFVGITACLLVKARAESLDTILQRMDANAKTFKSVTADMQQSDYNAVLKDEPSKSSAEMRIRRSKGGFAGVILYQPPEQRSIEFSGDKAKVYTPNANQVTIFNAGKYLSYVSEFLLFGSSGKELSKTYTITVAGTETIDGTPATHLVLTPKSPGLQKMITKLEVWIPEGKSYPVREKAIEPSGNSSLFSFPKVNINPSMPDSAFELKIPRDTKVIVQK
jgi:outer membrane lipoprotein-sorting protein